MNIRFLFFILLSLLFTGKSLFGQKISSPYSALGVGQITNTTFGANPGLGGTGISFLSGKNGINNLNPASYSGIDSLTFLFDLGFNLKYTNYSTSRSKNSKLDANIDHFAMGFRVTRFLATSMGIQPYSNIGYNINTTQTISGTLTEHTKNYYGEGGINKFFIGNSLRFNKNISLGMNISYIKGTIMQIETGYENVLVPDYSLSSTQYVNNLTFDYGVLFTSQIKNTTFRLGATYSQGKELETRNDLSYSSDIDTIEINGSSSSYSIPESFGFGLSLERERLLLGIDYSRKNWSGIKFDNSAIKIRNSEKISVGMQYIPQRNRSSYGLSNLDYRIGGFYHKSYLIIRDIPLDQMAFTLGFGIPFNRKLSKVNFSFEFGQFGTKKSGLIQEKYLLMHLNFNLRDIWFQQARYN
jgi:hypothetical protein